MHRNLGLFRRESVDARAEKIARSRERYKRLLVEDKGSIFNRDLTGR
jgi:succinate dehydrogenase/fumarate reductase flavoprotein subunit